MTLRYGLPLFLEDQSGRLTGSEFVDLYNRKKLIYRCISRDSTRTTYGIFDNSVSRPPKITLEFGADNSLGTIRVGHSNAIAMETYLPRVTVFARCCNLSMLYLINTCWSLTSSKSRHFIASDGQRYRWRHRYADDQEWAVSCFSFYPTGQRWSNLWDSVPVAVEMSSHTTVWNLPESLHTYIPLDACSLSRKALVI